MGRYAYCSWEGCELGLDEPTLRQGLGLQTWACPHGHANEVRDTDKEVIAAEFERVNERIDVIENHLWPNPMEE